MFVNVDTDYLFVDQNRALPFLPIWPGIIGSTLCFAVLWALIIFAFGGVGILRRWLRQRKNRCVRCAYSLYKLESKICPECGWEIGESRPLISTLRIICSASLAGIMLLAAAALATALIRRADAPPGPVLLAAAHNDVPKLKRLLASGLRIDERFTVGSADYNTTALMWAAARGNLEVVQALLDAGAQIDAIDGDGRTALRVAAEHGRDRIVELLLQHGADPSIKSMFGDDMLHEVAARGNPATLQILLNTGLALDRVEGTGWKTTPLGAAASAGHLENMRFLIKAGSSVNPNASTSPLMMAIESEQPAAAELLLEYGAAVNKPDELYLGEAADRDMIETARLLLAKGADPNGAEERSKGWTPIRRALVRSNLELMKMLVAAGADPQITDAGRETMLFDIDWDEASPEFIDFVLRLGIDINQQSNAGDTILMQQVHLRNAKAVQRLLKAGSDVTIRNNQGLTAMDHAERDIKDDRLGYTEEPVNPEIVRMLRERSNNR